MHSIYHVKYYMTSSHKRINIAFIGIGRWGKNLLREFDKISRVSLCIDKGNPANEQWLKKNYPRIKIAHTLDAALHDPAIRAVVIATPIRTHASIATRALQAGKHVFVEKPLATSSSDAKRIVLLAKNKKRALFVGHTFLYHPVFIKLQRILKKDPPLYARFLWEKFGTFGEDLLWNHGPHEVAIALALFGTPHAVTLLHQKGIITQKDIISFRLDFTGGRKCVIELNRLSPIKRKTITLITKKNIYVWENDLLYRLNKKRLNFTLFYHSSKTPLEIESQTFIDRIVRKLPASSDNFFELKVIDILSRLAKSHSQ